MQPGDGRVVSNFIVQALKGEDITLYGNGTQTRSFCYVDDLIRGLIEFMNQEQDSGPINMGHPMETTMLELARQVIQISGSRSRIVHLPLPEDDPSQRCPDIARARALLNWEPEVTLEVGLEKTISHFKKLVG
jgi:UDP-glucuronate decarboxylase